MNTQLQRMMAVLFLVLTIIAVTVLFWLPVNNDSDRIIVAKESAADGLLDMAARESQNPAVTFQDSMLEDNQDLENADVLSSGSSPIFSPGSEESSPSDDMDLIVDDSELRQGYDSAEYIADNIKAKDFEDIDINESGDIVAANTTSVRKQAVIPEDNEFAYDVMGNKRTHISDHTVRKNDWFAKVTNKYWDDLYMWPDLYTLNQGNRRNLSSSDPDLIYPGEKIGIYESLTADGDFSDQDCRTLLSAYLKVYKMYKQLGESKDLAAAQLLASAVRYDADFLDDYSSVIAAKDKQMAQRLLKEQKFLD